MVPVLHDGTIFCKVYSKYRPNVELTSLPDNNILFKYIRVDKEKAGKSERKTQKMFLIF